MDFYKNTLKQLMEDDLVYACVCSRTAPREHCNCRSRQIPFRTPDTAIRLKTGTETIFANTIDNVIVSGRLPDEMKDFIVWRKDGFPSYQLASVVDDVFFGVDLIVRGADLWSSTAAQLYLAEKMQLKSFLNATFHHHALHRNEQGEKLSKSAGALSVKHFRESGMNREAFVEHINAGKMH